MTYRQAYSNLYAYSLTPEQHERTRGHWFTVTNDSLAHAAFAARPALDRWLSERGLTLENDLPEAGTHGFSRIVGEYRTELHGERPGDDDGMEPGDFYSLCPIMATAVLSNGDYTLALITEDTDGVRTAHTLNPYVRGRLVFDRKNAVAWLNTPLT